MFIVKYPAVRVVVTGTKTLVNFWLMSFFKMKTSYFCGKKIWLKDLFESLVPGRYFFPLCFSLI